MTWRALIPAILTFAFCGTCLARSSTQQSGTAFQMFQDPASWSSYDGSLSVDSAHPLNGLSSLKLTAVPGQSAHAAKAISTNFAGVQTISFWVYAQYPVNDDGWHACSLYLTPDGFQNTFVAVTQKLHPGWTKVVFSKRDFQVRGNPNWNSTMTTLQVALFGDTSSGMSLSFADMELNELTRPKVIIAFDDNFASSYDYGYQYLKKYGFKGTEFVISSWVDQPGRATSGQLQEMYNYGWDMCNHTNTHPDLRTLTQSQVQSEYQTCTQYLISHGWTRNNGYLHLAYPQGHFNQTVLNADQAAGMLTARSTMKTLQANLIDYKYALYSEVPDSTVQSRADILSRIDGVVASGGALQIAFHNITPSPVRATDWRDTDFYAIIDYIALLQSRGLLDVVPFSEWYGSVQSASTPPITRLKVDAPQVTAGISTTGYVWLGAASGANVNVSLASSNPAASVPSNTVVAAGSTSSSFPVSTGWVTTTTMATLSASTSGTSQTCTVTVVPVSANFLKLDQATVTGGTGVWGHPYLNGPAQSGGTYVQIWSSNPAVIVPSSVLIQAGTFHGDFFVNTRRVTNQTTVTIYESYGGQTVSSQLVVNP